MIKFTKSSRVVVAISNGILALIGWYNYFKNDDLWALAIGLAFTIFLTLEMKGILKK